MGFTFWRKAFSLEIILLVACFSTAISSNKFIKVCRGTNYKNIVTSVSPLDEAAYNDLKLQFSNCTHVVGNLEIINIPDENTDLSFLQNIRQLTGYINIQNVSVSKLVLPNLEVIRGEDLMNDDSEWGGIALDVNTTNFQLELPKLKAVLNGVVPENYRTFYNSACSLDCIEGCFGPDKEQCCHANCVGGCAGPSNAECVACKHALVDGLCEDKCPTSTYSAHGICVQSCPKDLFRDGDLMQCVLQCSNDKDEKDNACVPCTPPKCKICLGATSPSEYISAKNIQTFRNCTILIGNLQLEFSTFRDTEVYNYMLNKYVKLTLNVRSLDLLSSLRRVRGSVRVRMGLGQGKDMRSLIFLRNLEEISEGLSIINTDIYELSLRSLKKVTGGIEITNNGVLCYAKVVNWSKISGDRSVIKIEDNRSEEICERLGEVCDDSCEAKDGCWGMGSENCLSCIKHQLNGKCEVDCSGFVGTFENETGSCIPCHSRCYECKGPGPENCTSCASYNYRLLDGNSCVVKCPQDKFEWKGKCIDCHNYCREGCTESIYSNCLASKLTTEATLLPPTTSIPTQSLSPEPSYTAEIVGASLATSLCITLGILCYFIFRRKKNFDVENKAQEVTQTEDRNMEENITEAIELETFTSSIRPQQEDNNLEENIPEATEIEPIASSSTSPPNLSKIKKIDSTELTKRERLSSGNFGVVYKGTWRDGGCSYPVAIKILACAKREEFLHEASVMFMVDHQNVLGLCGVCEEPSAQLITPLLMGSLLDYVKRERFNLGPKVMLDWSTQIAKGMEHLHGETLRIVHRDLALRNVLVETPTVIKITDFGLSRFLDRDHPQYEARHLNAPCNWLAIESIQRNVYTHKSDVWQFGVTVWELLMFGETPFRRNGMNALLGDFLGREEIRDFLLEGNRLQQPEACKDRLYAKLNETWRHES